MHYNRKTMISHYYYDPLDRLIASTNWKQASTEYFYLKDRLATQIQGTEQHSIYQHGDQLLAQLNSKNYTVEASLIASDQQRSVLSALDNIGHHPCTYTPYGHRDSLSGQPSLLGFNGEQPDPVTGWYWLGNGYRAFNPVLMRFNCPDSLSPFGEGGLNAYAYCVGDPVNREDPTGHVSWLSLMRKHFPHVVAIADRKSVLPNTLDKRSALKAGTSKIVEAPPSATYKSPSIRKTKSSNHFTSKKTEARNPANQKAITPQQSPSWTYSKKGATFKNGLTESEQTTFDTFQNLIKNQGLSPADAAKMAGDSNYKQLDNRFNIYQIRLSQKNRVLFEINDLNVKVRQVGGHT
ncbi:hypothetical protein PS918_05774 [Pseudomonas fluorescens]|uniref:Teneurin-like YD-shell domain-containing protein n=1 Tax=Pseudomonas fluorescens TaxID=294 RepID=A0A5E7UXN9_PSEFL|nr:RHS repeat-associated core domain-containing protein [Pseudomonas fluorescens]VVQ14796.1 hypothetical protein PS918_05774 [Pseudomonas fluorescens]